MNTKILEELENALKNGGLIELVQKMIKDGVSQVEIYDIFDQFADILDEADRKQEREVIIDLIDNIVGWCSPQYAFFSHYLTNKEIEEYQKSKINKF